MVIQNNAKHKSEYIWEHDFGIPFREEINDIPYLTGLLVIATHFEKYAQVKLIALSSNSPLKKNENLYHHRRSSETCVLPPGNLTNILFISYCFSWMIPKH